MSNIPEKVCYTCLRIDGKQFYRELRELGFTSADAAEIASWIKTIFETQPAFLSGTKAPAVKACLAFIGSKIYSPKQALNYHTITSFYGIKSPSYIYSSYKKYLSILKQGKPEILNLKRKPTEKRTRQTEKTRSPPLPHSKLRKRQRNGGLTFHKLPTQYSLQRGKVSGFAAFERG